MQLKYYNFVKMIMFIDGISGFICPSGTRNEEYYDHCSNVFAWYACVEKCVDIVSVGQFHWGMLQRRVKIFSDILLRRKHAHNILRNPLFIPTFNSNITSLNIIALQYSIYDHRWASFELLRFSMWVSHFENQHEYWCHREHEYWCHSLIVIWILMSLRLGIHVRSICILLKRKQIEHNFLIGRLRQKNENDNLLMVITTRVKGTIHNHAMNNWKTKKCQPHKSSN